MKHEFFFKSKTKFQKTNQRFKSADSVFDDHDFILESIIEKFPQTTNYKNNLKNKFK